MSGSNQLIYCKNYVSKNNLKQKKKQARRIAFSLYKKEIGPFANCNDLVIRSVHCHN